MAGEAVTEYEFNPGRIRALREGLGMTQDEFARRLGSVRKQTVSDWETGSMKPSMDSFLLIINTFGIKPEAFFRAAA